MWDKIKNGIAYMIVWFWIGLISFGIAAFIVLVIIKAVENVALALIFLAFSCFMLLLIFITCWAFDKVFIGE